MVGAVQVRPDVHEFTESAISFTDGTSEPIDAVVFATGYKYKIPVLDDSISKIEDNRTCLYKYMLPHSSASHARNCGNGTSHWVHITDFRDSVQIVHASCHR